MRIQIVKEVFASGDHRFYLRKKTLLFLWTKVKEDTPFAYYFEPKTQYFLDLGSALERLHQLIKIESEALVTDVEIVYDSKYEK